MLCVRHNNCGSTHSHTVGRAVGRSAGQTNEICIKMVDINDAHCDAVHMQISALRQFRSSLDFNFIIFCWTHPMITFVIKYVLWRCEESKVKNEKHIVDDDAVGQIQFVR